VAALAVVGFAVPAAPGAAPASARAASPPLAEVQPEPGGAQPGLSSRTASYFIDATLDPTARTLTGTSVVTWRNPGDIPAYSIRLHLYWNAWRNTESTWLRQRQLAGLGSRLIDRPAEDFGWQELTALAVVNPDGSDGPNLLPVLRFIQPEDHNPSDRSLAAADLPDGVPPGATLRLRIAWRAQVPRTFSRTGTIDRYFFMAHWFPKLGVFEPLGWNARQFFANTEFYADFGSYDVQLRVPQGWKVGATGRQVSRTDVEGGATIHRYVQDDVHDFAWTTSPDFVEFTRRFEHEGLPPVEMRLLLQPEHAGQEDRHFEATSAALRYYGEWFGAYPYAQITIVDPAWQSGSGGMEYPTLFTAGTRWLAPRQSNQPEGVTVHEAGHQFWYGMVANNEVLHAWMDEGLNTFSEERVQSIAFAPNYHVQRFFGGFIPWQFRDIPLSRATDGNGLNGYRRAATRDIPSMPTNTYWPATHAEITYSKTALWLHTLERRYGWDALRRALATYFHRWRFKHPAPDDFFAVLGEETGEDLTWFFAQVYGGSGVFDYAAERLESQEVAARGYFDDATDGASGAPSPAFGERRSAGQYRTTAVVRRVGDGLFPVDVLVRFANGDEVRERWDGQGRWRAFTYERPSPAVSVQVDPERVLLLDVNYTNNSITLAPRAQDAADRWTLRWIMWLQDLLMTWAFFV
jgi:hypothetical protein